jgi:hypothetical protein
VIDEAADDPAALDCDAWPPSAVLPVDFELQPTTSASRITKLVRMGASIGVRDDFDDCAIAGAERQAPARQNAHEKGLLTKMERTFNSDHG